MPEDNEPNYETVKQNMELTLLITFIGLAFGLVGLLVATARVMSIVVISVAVIVGFVSYHDAFRKRNLPHISEPSPSIRAPSPVAHLPPPPPPVQVAKPEPKHEPLPSLPKIQRLPSPEEAAESHRPKAPLPAESKPAQLPASTKIGEKKILAPRPRPRKPIEVAKTAEKKQD